MQPVRLGVVGCGVIGRVHAKAASQSPSISLVALADVREDPARALADEFHVGKVFSSAEALIQDPEVEAVVLALPACARTELAVRALSSGKHTLIEKPAAMCSADLEKVIAARGSRIAGCCSSRHRLLPSAATASAFVASGALGDLRLLRARGVAEAAPPPKSAPPPWRLSRKLNGGGILANWGCYDLDFLLGITGWSLRPKAVFAQTWPVPSRYVPHVAPGSDAESYVAALVRCENGAVILLERGEYLPVPVQNAWQVIGEHGSLSLDMLPTAGKEVLHVEADTREGVRRRTIWKGAESWKDVHPALLEDFALAVREGRPPATSLEQSLIIQRITDAVYASAERGTAVEIP